MSATRDIAAQLRTRVSLRAFRKLLQMSRGDLKQGTRAIDLSSKGARGPGGAWHGFWLAAAATVFIAAGVLGYLIYRQSAAATVEAPVRFLPLPTEPNETAPASEVFFHAAKSAYGDKKVELLRRAAEAGSIEGMYQLGMILRGGVGVPANTTEALKWLLQAARRGHVQAMHFSGEMYLIDSPMPDPIKAAKWFRRAANEGLADSMLALADLYDKGQGVEQDTAEALRLRAAAGAEK